MGRPKIIIGFALLIAGLALFGAGLWFLLAPAQYRATTRIIIQPDYGESSDTGQDISYNPYFIQTEFELIQSQIILDKVIATLNLNAEWGKKYAGGVTLATNQTLAILRRRMRVAAIPNTKYIAISYSSRDPKEAARIANVIAGAYQDYRAKMRTQLIEQGVQELTEQYQKDEQTIKASREYLERSGKQLNVPSPEPADDFLKTNYPAYFQDRQELQKKVEFHKILGDKIDEEKLILSTPKTASVTIADPAKPPKSPAGPNRSLGAALLVIGLGTLAGGWRLPGSCRRSPAR
jgi:uncharacterized protein involved in exopolysaccharide biosynthesis